MEEEKIENSGIGGAAVVVLILSHVDAYLLARSRCEHVVLLKLEPSLTDQKFRYATERSASGVYSFLELLVESLQFTAKLRAISFHDFINEFAKRRRDKYPKFPGMIHAETSLSLHPLDDLARWNSRASSCRRATSSSRT